MLESRLRAEMSKISAMLDEIDSFSLTREEVPEYMRVVITFGEAQRRGVLGSIISAKGWDPYRFYGGNYLDDEEISLTEEQAVEVGLIRQGEGGVR